MILFQDGKRMREDGFLLKPGTKSILFIEWDRLHEAVERLALDRRLLHENTESAANHFESHAEIDCLSLNIPDASDEIQANPIRVFVFIAADYLVFAHQPLSALDALAARLEDTAADPLPFEQALNTFLNLLTAKDGEKLEDMEESIALLEDAIAEDAKEGDLQKISALRKILLKKKRYYESLQDALEDMAENENHLYSKQQLQALRIITNRVNRHFHSVLNLRDYVTQVRESYQAQMDIQLNKIMKLFTVITAVFLPLSLLAGWYGMNLQMPEYANAYMYPIVIISSVLILAICLVYFKKNKWF